MLSLDYFQINQFSDFKKLIYLTMVTHELIRCKTLITFENLPGKCALT